MRIAHFMLGRCNPDSPNGVDKTIYHLSRNQAALDNEVCLFQVTEKPVIDVPGVDVRAYPPVGQGLAGASRVVRDFAAARAPWNVPRRLLTEMFEWRPDVIHLHYVHIPQNLVVARAARKRGIPYVVTPNGGLALRALQRHRVAKSVAAFLFERRYLQRAGAIHVVSGLDEEGLRSMGVTTRTIRVPNGIDRGSIPEAARRRSLPPPEGVPRQGRVVAFLGRLDIEQKNLDTLIRAFSRLDSERATLVLAGPDWRGGRATLESLVANLRLSERVALLDPLLGDAKWAFLSSSDVFIHPSRWEAGVPFSVLEALAVGTPVLASPGSDPDALIQEAGAGIRTGTGADEIAVGLEALLQESDDSLRARGARAAELVESRFDWSGIAAEVTAAYRESA